jgi:hypothetical protein
MVILGEVLMVGGSALVVCSAIFWAWPAIKQKLLRGPDEALDQPAGPPSRRLARESTLATEEECHLPPREDLTPRSLSALAIEARLGAPQFELPELRAPIPRRTGS